MKFFIPPLETWSVAAGVPPAVEGGVSPPGIPGSTAVSRSISNRPLPTNLLMQAFARVETGSLTPTLSRGERESRMPRGDTQKAHPSEPSRLVPANVRHHPPQPAGNVLLLTPGEGRDEGRPLHSSRLGSGSPCISMNPIAALVLLLIGSWTSHAAAPAPSPTPIGTVVHWLFSPDRLQGSSIKPVAGSPDITPQGIRLLDDPAPARVELPGKNQSLVAGTDLAKLNLPKQDISVEAWVRVDRPLEWGGIVGAIQDNGDSEWGWLLGYRNDTFSFALSAQQGGDRLTYLQAREPFLPGHWYHVVGTYDGKEQRLYVNGSLAARDAVQSGPIRYPTQASLVVGAYRDDDEHHPLSGALHEALILRRAMTAAEISERHSAKASIFPQPAPEPIRFAPAYGPFVDWKDRTSAIVSWETDVAMPSVLELVAPDGSRHRVGNTTPSTQHVLTLEGLSPNEEYFYRLRAPDREGRPVQTQRYLFDTSFYYAATPSPASNSTPTRPDAAKIAEQILLQSSVHRGYCLMLGATDGAVAVELVRQSDLEIVVVESDPKRVQAVRRLFDQAGIQGVRAAVHHVEPGPLPFGDYVANLIVSEQTLADGQPPRFSASEIARVLRPSGGVLLLGTTSAASPQSPALAGAGEWSHQYGSADNTSTSHGRTASGRVAGRLVGRSRSPPHARPRPAQPLPGERRRTSLHPGRPHPVRPRRLQRRDPLEPSAPEIRRANVPRDCSNMAAVRRHASSSPTAVTCLAFDGVHRPRVQRFEVPHPRTMPNPPPTNWGYLACSIEPAHRQPRETRLPVPRRRRRVVRGLRTPTRSAASPAKRCSARPTSGAHRWTYRGGAILNSTITIGDGMIFFIESRNPKAVEAPPAASLPRLLTDHHLVALDLRTGSQRLWEKAQDFSKCEFMTYLVYSRNTVVVTGTDRDKTLPHLRLQRPRPKTRPATSTPRHRRSGALVRIPQGGQGSPQRPPPAPGGHRRRVLLRPALLRPGHRRNPAQGPPRTPRLRHHVRRPHAIFFRHHYPRHVGPRLRQTLPVRGHPLRLLALPHPCRRILLAPETSAGCSCTHAIQTSMGFVPKALRKP
jgi:SAM-dependent methyltransferase